MSRRLLSIAVLSAGLAVGLGTRADEPVAKVDVVVYGGTPAGIAAALAAASDGDRVLLVEPTARLGGLTTCGLSHPDFRTFEALNGTYLDLTRRVERYYRDQYGDQSEQVKVSLRGTHAEPKVNLLVFEQMLAEQPRMVVWRERRLKGVETTDNGKLKHVAGLSFVDRSGATYRVTAAYAIDATYEGDLLAAAGAKYRVGREAASEYDESLAPAQADDQLQAYNFRLIATRDANNRVAPSMPAGYQREQFVDVLPLLDDARIKTVFGYPSSCLYKAQIPSLPNGKFDLNDVSRGIVRLSLPGENLNWPEGDAAARQRIFDDHLRWNVGLLYFLQHDEAVPVKYRDEARQWGWCRDEFVDSDHLPPQLYVREARRLVGQYVFTEHDTDHAPSDARSVLRTDAIAMGDYGPNCHGTDHEGSRFGGKHTGEFYKQVSPYQIPYGVLVPREVDNLLVPVACSASHVGFCALRLEPIWTSLGQAAGHAVHVARSSNLPVQRVPVDRVQVRLHRAGSATIYVNDVPPGSADFQLVQWWATAGGLHGLAPLPQKPGQRGKHIIGQYYEAFPNHAAELDTPLDATTAARWARLAGELGLPTERLPTVDDRTTRGDWLQKVAKLRPAPVDDKDGLTPEYLDLSLEPPVVNTRPGPQYDDDARDYNMIIGMDHTPKGRIWACWVSGGDNQEGYFVAATSDDQGLTWSKPRLVIDPTDPPGPVKRRALVGNFWTDPRGRLWLFFDQSMGYFDGRGGVWFTRCDDPDAEQTVWTRPERIWHGFTLNKPTVLKNGDWLLPISLWNRDRITQPILKDLYPELDDQRMAHVFASSDEGKTWRRRGGVRFPGSEFDEHMTVELNDGRLWMLARTNYGGIAESYSTDGGHQWSLPQPSNLRNPSARFHIRRLKSGRLLLVKHGPVDLRIRGRSDLTAYLSDDDGKTWQGGLLLDQRAKVSYPDGFQSPDGMIYILYDYNRGTDAEILLARFREEDILAGDFKSPQAQARLLVNKALRAPKFAESAERWQQQALEDAKQDRVTVAYDGVSPNRMVCDTTLRELPDRSWVLFMLAGGNTEPSPENYTGVTRSTDQGRTWSKLEPFDVGFPRSGTTIGQGPTELMIRDGRCTLFFSTHSKHWNSDWRSWFLTSDDSFRTWGKPQAIPGRLQNRTFIRNHIVTRDGRIIAPFQHYIGPAADADKPPLDRAFTNPRNGVIISADGGKTWSEHGNIRLTENDRYFGWAENNLAELSDGRIAMIIRADRLGGVLYYAESKDGGRTWPEFASLTNIPNPGSKATLYPLGGDTVAMLHNPNPKHRSPMALWISFDGLKTWPYRRVLVAESCDGPTGRMNYPDGFVSADRQWLHFAFDDNRHRAVCVSAKLPPLP